MTTNTFCRHLSNGYRIYINGSNITYMPCCQWTGPALPFRELARQRQELNISTPWSHWQCQRCGQEESAKGEQAYRLTGNRVIASDLPDTKVGWLDIQADVTCNGGCLICGPGLSTFWQSEISRYQEQIAIQPKTDLSGVIARVFDALDVSELNLLQFLGGEPFLSTVDQLAIPYIINPQRCRLKYTTNGSVWPKAQRWQQWKNFQTVTINFSVDGVGDRFEYLRYPLSWSTVSDNIKRFVDEALSNMKFHINHTLTPFNVLYYHEFMAWVNETFDPESFLGVHTHTAYGTMSVANCNDAMRRAAQDMYGDDHVVTKTLLQNPQISNDDFFRYVNLWDHRRRLNWREIFPELHRLLG